MRPTLLAVALSVVVLGGVAAANELLNPGFESGDLSGWESSVSETGFAAAVTVDYGLEAPTELVLPVEGDHFAVLESGDGFVPTRIWRTFTVPAGAAITGWARFLTREFYPYDDFGEVVIREGSVNGPVVTTLFWEGVSTVGDWGATDWTFFAHVFEQAGTYVLEASVTNEYDAWQDSWLCLDDVAVTGLVATPSNAPLPAPTGLSVAIDVKPGSDANPIQLKAKGKLPVAILGSAAFDPSTVDVGTLLLGPGGAMAAHEDGHLEDVDGDGYLDLVVHFPIQDLGLVSGDAAIELVGSLYDGVPFQASDVVSVK